ncbi:MAG TPA: tetratricopeptide repeat protein [Polyangiaceae bacterium]|nr:tetratricopeptide repeat protein [Polyangiaceae bacterium]
MTSEPKPPTRDEDEPESAPEPAKKAKSGAPAGRKKRPGAAAKAAAPRDEAEGEADEAAAADDEGGDEGGEGEGEGAEAEEAAPPPNRHERRRRKAKGDDDEVRDRNARLRQQLRQKRAEAERVNLTPLTTGEMVDDALARGMASLGKWARRNANNIQTALGLLILAGGAYGIYHWRTTSSAEEASSLLFQGVLADRGRVLEKDAPAPKADEEVYPVYRDPNERITNALASYRATAQKFDGSGAAILARLGEAGMLLDKRAYDEALKAYTDVRSSALGQADVDVKGRAIEGAGFALEGKGDHEGALKAFRDLESVAGFKELALYHQARLSAAKGDKTKALEFVRAGREALAAAAPEGKAQRVFVSEALDELHRSIDPASAPPKLPMGGLGGPGGPQISPQDLLRLQEQLKGMGDKGTP